MRTNLYLKANAFFVLFFLSVVYIPGSQVDQRQTANGLLSRDSIERRKALNDASRIPVNSMGDQLRNALVIALERQNSVMAARFESDRRGLPLEPLEDPEAYLTMVRIVVRLKTPDALPSLIGALATGLRAAEAVAQFRVLAFPAVMNIARTPGNRPLADITGSLNVLRYMVEDPAKWLDPGRLEDIRKVAEQHLRTDDPSILLTTIELAGSLKNPELLRTIAAISTNAALLESRGITDPDSIRRIQQRAAQVIKEGPRALPRF